MDKIFKKSLKPIILKESLLIIDDEKRFTLDQVILFKSERIYKILRVGSGWTDKGTVKNFV